MKEKFQNPPKEYRPMPFWFLNAHLEPDEIEWQVEEMGRMGVGGFFLHARNGLEIEYLSKEWFDLLEVAVKKAERLGLKAWLYDEYPYPSGIGGLKVTRIPEYRYKFIDLIVKEVIGPKDICISVGDGEVLLAVSVRDYRVYYLKKQGHSGQFRCEVPSGRWEISLFVKRIYSDPKGCSFAPDYLNKKAMEFWFSTTHKLYEKRLGKYFGSVIPGIFTDEPCIMAWHQTNPWTFRCHHDQKIAVWSDSVEERLNREYGYRVRDVLPSIFYDWNGESKIVRGAYRKVVTELYIESFLLPYKNWCERHSLKLTGHLFQEEGLYANMLFGGDFFKSLGCFHIPGSDHLLKSCERKDGGYGHKFPNSTNVQGQKLVSSIAHSYKKETVLTETFGAAGWVLDLEDMKWISDWLFTLGTNLICPHAFYYSLEGYRKGDFPASHFFQSTFWRYYKGFTDYIGRVSLALRGGRHVAQIAIIYPLASFEREYRAGIIGKKDRLISDYFDFYTSTLLRLHYDYDIVHESLVIPQVVKTGMLKIKDEHYEVLIFPPMSVMSEENLTAAEELARGGGLVIFSGILPSDFLDDNQKSCRNRLEGLLKRENCHYIRNTKVGRAVRDTLEKILKVYVTPDVTIDREEINYIHKRKGGSDIYFFANTSNETGVNTTIKLKNTGLVEKWDLETGEVRQADIVLEDKYWVTINERFHRSGSCLIVVKEGRRKNNKVRRVGEPKVKKIMNLGMEWQFKTETSNILILDRWFLEMVLVDIHQSYCYTAIVHLKERLESVLLVLDDIESRLREIEGMKLTVRVNGLDVKTEFGWFKDKKFKTLEIGQFLKEGKNRIELEFYNLTIGGESKVLTSYPKLLGNFKVGKRSEISSPGRIIRIGDWAGQGYPYFSGTGIYTKEFQFERDSNMRYYLLIEEVGDVVEMFLNGKAIKTCLWPPFEAEITNYLRNGSNILMFKITNSPSNFMDGILYRKTCKFRQKGIPNQPDIEPKSSGLLGPVWIAESSVNGECSK